MGLQQVVVGHPESRRAGAHQGLDLGLVRVVQRDDLATGRQGLERVHVILGHLVDADLRAAASDHFNVVPPIGRQVGERESLFGRLDDFQAAILGRHLAVPNPHDVAAGVDRAGEVEAALGRHHAQDAAGQGGMFGVVLGGDPRLVDVDVEVDAAATRAAADFHVGQGASGLFDLLQLVVVEPDALGVPGQGVEVVAKVPRAASLPVPARHADSFGVKVEGVADLVVLPRRLRGGVLRDADGVPGIAAVGPGGFLSRHRLAVAGNDVHLGLHRNRPPIHEIGVCGHLAGVEEVREGFAC